jgi:hypothetical protein
VGQSGLSAWDDGDRPLKLEASGVSDELGELAELVGDLEVVVVGLD